MINTIFWFADSKSQYDQELATQGVSDKTIVFIKETGEIYVNNKNYGKSIQDLLNDPEIASAFNNDSILKLQVQDMIDALENKLEGDIDHVSNRTLIAKAGPYIDLVGTPSVTITKDTENNTETFTFNYLKGLQGERGQLGPQGSQGPQGNPGNNGNDGKTPYIQDGYWYIDGVNTGVKARGEDGQSVGSTIELDTDNTWVKYSTLKTQSKPADSTFTLTVPPTLSPGDWLWSLTQITYKDGTVLKTYNVSRIGDDGDKGDPGDDGWSTHFAYAQIKNGVEIPSNGKLTTSDVDAWSLTNFPGANAIGTYRDRSDHDSTNIADYAWSKFVGPKGDRGEDGKDGTGINIKGTVNSSSELATVDTSSLNAGDAYMVGSDLYVWTGSSWRNVGRIQGPQGEPGDDAVQYYLHIAWANSSDGSIDFTVSPVNGVEYEYMGTCIDTNFADPTNYSLYTWVKVGKTGPEGPEGQKGTSITTVTEYYLASASSSGISNSNSAFTTSVQQASKDKPYLWNYEEIAFSNNTSHKSDARIIAQYTEGKGIDRIDDYYMLTTNNQTPAKSDSSWSTSVPVMTSTNKYLWNYEITYYTDGTSSSTDVRCIGVYGDTGNASAGHDYSDDIALIWNDINKKGNALGDIVTTNENGEVTGITNYLATKINDTIAGTYSNYDSSTASNTALAALFALIDKNKSDIALVATKVTNNSASIDATAKLNDFTGQLATIADVNGVKSWLSAVSEDPNTGVVTAASIVAAVNGAGSSVTVNADKIKFTGSTEFTSAVQAVELNADKITSGTIDTDRLDVSSIFGKANEDGSSITLSADHINLAGHVWGDQITADTIIGKLNNATGQTQLKIDSDIVDISGIQISASNVTGIGELVADTIAATDVVAANLVVKAANIQGNITANSLAIKNSSNEIVAALNSDGSGQIAKNGISWTTDGTLTANKVFLNVTTPTLPTGYTASIPTGRYRYEIYDENNNLIDSTTYEEYVGTGIYAFKTIPQNGKRIVYAECMRFENGLFVGTIEVQNSVILYGQSDIINRTYPIEDIRLLAYTGVSANKLNTGFYTFESDLPTPSSNGCYTFVINPNTAYHTEIYNEYGILDSSVSTSELLNGDYAALFVYNGSWSNTGKWYKINSTDQTINIYPYTYKWDYFADTYGSELSSVGADPQAFDGSIFEGYAENIYDSNGNRWSNFSWLSGISGNDGDWTAVVFPNDGSSIPSEISSLSVDERICKGKVYVYNNNNWNATSLWITWGTLVDN